MPDFDKIQGLQKLRDTIFYQNLDLIRDSLDVMEDDFLYEYYTQEINSNNYSIKFLTEKINNLKGE